MAAVKINIVQSACGYNSWPMLQNIKSRLICIYSRGSRHSIGEPERAVYARHSDDYGETWSREITVCNSAGFGDVPTGKGFDDTGAALFWVRRCKAGKDNWNDLQLYHDLYRSVDGVSFEKISSPWLSPDPMQITDIFHIPEKNVMMSLWFAGNYQEKNSNSWGTLISEDNGVSWKQNVIEDKLPATQWPTEQSAVYLGNGKIFAIARHEPDKTEAPEKKVQFQLESDDFGKSWSKKLTNINDIWESTPSLLLGADGKIYNYYYQRRAGLLKRRVVAAEKIIGTPLAWCAPEILTAASADACNAGNVNAVAVGGQHFVAYYTGTPKNTAVVVLAL